MDVFRYAAVVRLLLILLVLSCCGVGSSPEARRRGRGRRRHRHQGHRRHQGGSILEHIDTDAVSQVLEARRNQTDTYDFLPPLPIRNTSAIPDYEQRRDMARQIRPHLLKSSRRARIITKRRYLKKDWCKTEPLVQRLREPGCRSLRIINNFCYGQCNSFYIPRENRRPGREAFKSCAFCKPRQWEMVTVTFHCPGKVPAQRRRAIQLVKKCRCMQQQLTR